MLRAYAYWSLGWQWGGVPLITKTTPLAEIRKIPRSTQEVTLGQAISDYKEAIRLLPEEWGLTKKSAPSRREGKPCG